MATEKKGSENHKRCCEKYRDIIRARSKEYREAHEDMLEEKSSQGIVSECRYENRKK